MRISDIINRDSVEIGADICSKDEALERLTAIHRRIGNIYNSRDFLDRLKGHEREHNSAVACRIAIPALSDDAARNTRITALTLHEGVEYGAPDHRKVRLLFLIAGRGEAQELLMLKTRLMRLLMDAEFSARLGSAKSAEEFVALIREQEQRRFSNDWKDAYDCSKFLRENNKKRPHPLRMLKRRLKMQKSR
jgi:mannitol/fructose-specific phosphotransferase system IIA component (Ntr-type)